MTGWVRGRAIVSTSDSDLKFSEIWNSAIWISYWFCIESISCLNRSVLIGQIAAWKSGLIGDLIRSLRSLVNTKDTQKLITHLFIRERLMLCPTLWNVQISSMGSVDSVHWIRLIQSLNFSGLTGLSCFNGFSGFVGSSGFSGLDPVDSLNPMNGPIGFNGFPFQFSATLLPEQERERNERVKGDAKECPVPIQTVESRVSAKKETFCLV